MSGSNLFRPAEGTETCISNSDRKCDGVPIYFDPQRVLKHQHGVTSRTGALGSNLFRPAEGTETRVALGVLQIVQCSNLFRPAEGTETVRVGDLHTALMKFQSISTRRG